MATKYLGVHEALEAHELLVFKNLCLTKSVTMKGFVQDEELRTIFTDDVDRSTQFISRLQELLHNRGHQS